MVIQRKTGKDRWITARLNKPLAQDVDFLVKRGYTPSEIVWQGIRLVKERAGVA